MSAHVNTALLKIGELAKRTGVSVRALHHYDEIGLLSPSHRTAAGHRLYTEGDVARLQQIRSLRELGLGLDDIAQSLSDPALTLRRVVELHVARLRDRIEREEDLCSRLERVLDHTSEHESAPVQHLLYALEGIAMSERYFSAEQRRLIAERANQIGTESIAKGQRDWDTLMREVQQAMDRGDSPQTEHVRDLALRWHSLSHEFTGGDPGLARGVRAKFEREPSVHGIDTAKIRAMWAFLGPAMSDLGLALASA
jgi:MerR family transcriptional regulator, thiopeptide resistance regulator